MAADIYAFGCLVYEMLTGQLLFDGTDEVALVSKHVSHDGWRDELARMATISRLDPLANLIGTCLRHDGRNRPDSVALRSQLTPALLPVTDLAWPLDIEALARTG
jgi:serine/threonine protein kinase